MAEANGWEDGAHEEGCIVLEQVERRLGSMDNMNGNRKRQLKSTCHIARQSLAKTGEAPVSASSATSFS